MKTWAKAAIAAAVLGAVVSAYVVLQAPVESGIGGGVAATLRPSARPVDESGGVQGIGAGERPWANQYDERGELAYRFRALQYNPVDAGTVNVMAPTFEFYLSGGRRVRLTGETGQVFLPRRGAARGDAFGGQATLPTRGTLQNVRITLLEPDSEVSTLTAVMDNVIFDNDTLRIWTGDAVIDGVPTPGSKVPVTIRGDDYDFDGEGLTIQLAQRGERTIQRVEVARATRLLIKSSEVLGDARIGRGGAVREDHLAPHDVRVASAGDAAWGGLLGQAGGVRVGGGGGGAVVRPVADTVYRATIRSGVRVTQGPTTTLTGEVMQIDFSSAPRPGPAASATPPPAPAVAPPPSPRPDLPLAAASAVQTPPVAPSAAGTPAPPSKTSPREPILITWDGPLRVEADAGDPRTPAGEAIVTVFGAGGPAGAPVELLQDGSRAVAAVMSYETGPRRATLQSSDAVPVTLTDDRGSVLTTTLLHYNVPERVAVVTGPSVVRGAVDQDEVGRPRPFLASWSRSATIRFEPDGAASDGAATVAGGRVRSAELIGSVRVDHPELKMTGERLALAFDPQPKAADRPQGQPFGGADLTELLAEGNVATQLVGSTSVSSLRARQVRLTTRRGDDGRTYPERLESMGDVVAGDGRQTLRARGLVIELVPDPTGPGRPDGGGVGLARVKPQTLSASGDVLAAAEDGSEVRAQTLTVGNLSGDRVVFIEGPDASVSADGSVLTAGRIVYREADGSAVIPSGGTLRGVQKAQRPGDRDTPFEVTWRGDARFTQDADSGRIDVRGDVALETVDADGAIATATSKAMTVRLTGTSKQPGQASLRAAESSGGVPQMRMLGQRQLSTVELAEDVRLQSLLGDGEGQVVRQFNLLCEKVRYEASGRLEVPGPGRLLLIDRRVPDQRRVPEQRRVSEQKPQDDAAPREALATDGRGNTAMKWDERLVYEPAERRLVFDGAVVFVHEPLSGPVATGPAESGGDGAAAARRYRLDSDRLTAYLEADAASGANAAAGGGLAGVGQVEQVRTVIAQGEVVFRADGLTVTSAELEYVPSAQVVLARGTDRVPVRVDEDRALGTGTFSSARINLRTGMVEEVREPRGNIGIGGMPLPAPRRSGGR